MDWNFLLGKRRGRIARKPFWIATLAIYGLGVLAVFASYYAAVHHGVLNAQEFGTIVNALISVQLFLMCPVILKRLHDRDRTSWWLIPIWIAPQAYVFFGQHLIDAVSGSFAVAETVFNTIIIVIASWAAIELGFMRGTAGPNRFGANPLPIRLPAGLRTDGSKFPLTGSRRAGATFAEAYVTRLHPGARLSPFHPLIADQAVSLHI